MIFNFFKSKPTLKELIPNAFVDIHSHILPGIDDGAKNIEESLKLVSEMKKIGFSKIIGTPHTYTGLYENTPFSIKKSFDLISSKIKSGTKINYASEYLLDKNIVEKVRNNDLLCLKEKYVLVEMSYLAPPINLYEILFELRVNDFIPIIAHPERYIFFEKNFNEYIKLKKVGCLFQANLLSTTGYYGSSVLKLLEKLLGNNLIDFVGSDIHNMNHIRSFENKIQISNFDHLEKSILKTKEIFYK